MFFYVLRTKFTGITGIENTNASDTANMWHVKNKVIVIAVE